METVEERELSERGDRTLARVRELLAGSKWDPAVYAMEPTDCREGMWFLDLVNAAAHALAVWHGQDEGDVHYFFEDGEWWESDDSWWDEAYTVCNVLVELGLIDAPPKVRDEP